MSNISSFLLGFFASFVASGIFWLVLIGLRPRIKVAPAILIAKEDQKCYIILQHTYLSREANDLKINAYLVVYTKKINQFFVKNEDMWLPIPVYNNGEISSFRKKEILKKRERILRMPLQLNETFWLDARNQIRNKSINYAISDLLKKEEPTQEEISRLFEKLTTDVYDGIFISINYQDSFSGIRKTSTFLIREFAYASLSWESSSNIVKRRKKL